MTRIPLDAEGYSVNIETGTIHTRYAREHAPSAIRTRTEKGVRTLLNGKDGSICKVCYPSPRYAVTTPRPPQQRRSGSAKQTTKPRKNAAPLPGV